MTEPTDKVEVRKARPAPRWAAPLAALALAAAVWLVFRPVLGYEFTNYDERQQILENPLARSTSLRNFWRVFTSRGIYSYYPVRLASYAVDHAVWGMDPTGFHLTNLVLHTANVVLLFWLALRLVRRAAGSAETWAVASAALGAGLFALHPVVVEPVAWIAGREELLMVVGTMVCFHFHLSARRAEDRFGRPNARAVACHLGAVAGCLAGCGSNVVGAVIPALVTLWDVLSLTGPKLKRILPATLPLWFIGAATVGVKLLGPQPPGGEALEATVPLSLRPAVALDVFGANLRALVWPAEFAALYPWYLPQSLLEPSVLAGGAAALAAAAGLFLLRRRRRIVFGLGWFLLGLAPASQIVLHHIYRADRLMYLPLAGLAIAAGAALVRFRRRAARAGALVASVLALGLWGTVAARRLPVWQDSVSLFAHTLKLNPESYLVHRNLGLALVKRGDVKQGTVHLRRSAALRPDSPQALNDLGGALLLRGELDEATAVLREAVRRDVDHADAHYNLGLALARQGQPREALRHCLRALAIDDTLVDAHNNAGLLIEQLGRPREAAKHYRQALEADPRHAPALYNWANLRVKRGHFRGAVRLYRRALKLQPDYVAARTNLALALARTGDHAGAVGQLERLLADDPDSAKALAALARVLATSDDPEVRDPERAVQLAERACERTNRTSAMALGSLATAYAADGRVPEAIAAAEEALEVAEAAGEEARARRLRRRLNRYHRQLQNQDAPRP